ncbi:MAG: DUF2298 domain-containing protein, partial [Anaerolineae bacterium]
RARAARWGALLGPLVLVLMGNLEGVLEVLHARGLLSAGFWEWLDIRSINVAPPPFAEGSWIPDRFMWWWQASRVLHDTAPWHTPANPADWEVIDEFPAFSFILGDMHPHLLSLPFTLLALALALNLFFSPPRTPRNPPDSPDSPDSSDSPILLILSSLCLGGLGFLNTWDLPVYFAVFAAAFLLSAGLKNWKTTLPFCLLLLASCIFLYLPFWLGLRSQASGILPNLFNPTRLPQFLVMFGPLLFPIVVWTVGEARERGIRGRDAAFWTAAIVLVLLVLLLFAVLVHPQGRFYLTALRSGAPIPGLESVPDAPRLILGRLRERLLSPWTALFLTALLVLASPLPPTPSPEVWLFRGRRLENRPKWPPARPEEQKENIFHCGGFAAAVKNNLSFILWKRPEACAGRLWAKRPNWRVGGEVKGRERDKARKTSHVRHHRHHQLVRGCPAR